MTNYSTRLYEGVVRVDRAADGTLTFACHQASISEPVDAEGNVIAGRAFVSDPVAVTAPELLAILTDQIPAAVTERDALQAQFDQAQAGLTAMTDARDALQAQLDAILKPDVRKVIRQRFEMALDQLGLLDQWEALVAGSPRQTQIRADYPEYYETDAMLLQAFTLLVGADQATAELAKVFDLAETFA